MGVLVDKMNAADRMASLWRQGLVTVIAVEESLIDLGFYAIDFGEHSITARFNGIRYELDGTFYSLSLEA